ncbi:MAG TPA: RNA polymerase sigma factor SigZ [Gammaproteobacteria bacterium]|nr:RNA polymerase sigma factor SigZ [Gammaproteobacteria bacterium]
MTEPETWTMFNGHLRAYIARRVDAASVDDVLGEIYLRVARHQDKFENADNPLAWLYRVAGNIITDHYRRRAAERTALQQAGADASEADASGENDNYAELAECLIPMIRQLPEAYREALLLTDIQGTAQAAVAAQLGLSVSGMKSRVQRGREQLKKALFRCCEIEVNRRGRIVGYMQRDCSGFCGKDRT